MKYLAFLLTLLTVTRTLGALAPADKAELGVTKNYISNSGFERGLAGVKVYANTAGILPVTGTGGTPTHLSVITSLANPLRDKYSLVITNSGGSSAQGEGVLLATFTVDNADKGKVLQVSMDYQPVTGTFNPGSLTVDSDLELYLYDVANSAVIQPSAYKLDCSVLGLACTVRGVFQTAINATSYRLLAHVPTVNTPAWAIRADTLVAGPQVKTNGFAASDLISAGVNVITATTTAPTKGTIANDVVRYRRDGDHIHQKGEFKQSAAGTAGSGDYLFQLATGSFDPNKVTFYTGNVGGVEYSQTSLGSATFSNNSNVGLGMVIPYDTTRFRIAYTQTAGGSSSIGFLGSGTFPLTSTSLAISYDFMAPIAGWSSNTIGSADAGDSRTVAVIVTGTPAAVTANAPIIFPTVQQDTHSAYNAATGQFTAPLPGFYDIAVTDASTTSTAGALVNVYRAGTLFAPIGATSNNVITGAGTVYALAGQTIDVRPAANFGAGTSSSLSIRRVNTGNQQVTATEQVAVSAWLATTTSFGADAAMTYGSVEFDTHGAWNGSVFKAPAAGLYQFTLSGGAPNAVTSFRLWKNAAAAKNCAQNASSGQSSGSCIIRLITGDLVDVRSVTGIQMTGGALATSGTATLGILRIGL